MGRTEKSQGLAPPAVRKDIRAKQARHVVNKVVPAILASSARARRGVDDSELIADPGLVSSKQASKVDAGGEVVAYVKRKGQGRRKAKGGQEVDDEEPNAPKGKARTSVGRRNDSIDKGLSHLTLTTQPEAPTTPQKHSVKVITTDSLTAARILSSTHPRHPKKLENACILNMASPLRPGGGVLAGATSQEEFLCARTTLLPSLKEAYYRLPEYGGIFTHDVLVFRGPGPLGDGAGELGVGERYWVDVISAGMLRFPDLEGEDDEVKRLGKKDREIMERKMRAVLRIAATRKVKRLILGAWGCGAYGNPVLDVAQAWSRVLSGAAGVGRKKGKVGLGEIWPDLEDVVFAIPNHNMAKDFADAFGDGIEVEEGPRKFVEDDEGDDEEDKASQELQSKIEEMESQISKVWNPDLKARLGIVLDGLKAQSKESRDVGGEGKDSSDESDVKLGEATPDEDAPDDLESENCDESHVDAVDEAVNRIVVKP
ncbi:hypothetical protein SVAN01_04410 [Stagonosporopsis vannaccii]|nr:hypothetical protein SVAN01_04410 [Stagonosporopsis vannaccii]